MSVSRRIRRAILKAPEGSRNTRMIWSVGKVDHLNITLTHIMDQRTMIQTDVDHGLGLTRIKVPKRYESLVVLCLSKNFLKK